jgi:hypothetical protein
MDFKSTLKRKGKEASVKILPMVEDIPSRVGVKVRVASAVIGIIVALTLISIYLGN